MRIAIAILFLFVQLASASFTNVVPAWRHIYGYWGTNWQGVQWPYQTSRVLYTNMVGLATDPTDVAATLQSAIDNASSAASGANVQIVRIPAGTYFVNGSLIVKAGMVLQGDTNGGTTFHFTNGSVQAIEIGLDQNPGVQTIFSGYTRGSSNITMAASSDSLWGSYSVGDMLWMTQTNDTNFIMGISGNVYAGQAETDMGFTTRITGVSNGTNLSIWPPLLWDLKTSLGPQAKHWPTIRSNIGLEFIRMDLRDTTLAYGIFAHQIYGGWIANVTVTNAYSLGIVIDKSLQCEVVNCTVATAGHGAANSGVGIESFFYSCWDKIENNTCTRCFQGIQFDYGCSANAFLYNWVALGSNQSQFVAADINGSHGAGNIYNLFEGNKCSHFQIDPTHGSAGNMTMFRNHFLARIQDGAQSGNQQLSTAVSINTYCYSNSIVGNVLGDPQFPLSGGNGKYIVETNTPLTVGVIYSFGLPNQGNRDWSGVQPPGYNGFYLDNFVNTNGPDGFWTTVYKANVIMPSNAVPSSESIGTTNLESSLFYQAKPTWYSNFVWPPFGPDVVNFTNMLPAEARWYGIAQPVTSYGPTGSRARGIKLRR